MTKKMKQPEPIDSCWGCVHLNDHNDWCGKEERPFSISILAERFPDWCPLEDEETE